MTRSVVLLLTIATGFAGLAYEVTWQKYLATLLGAHSEATAAVLAIFLGGLAAGYQGFGRLTERLVARSDATGKPPPLLVVYGGVEIAIGLFALAFPWLFRGIRAASLALPALPDGLAFAVDIGWAAVLIGPPAVLMGATIPVLTQALSRNLEDATRFHALVYGFNTVGAFGGALAAGFWLIPLLGLDGVVRAMGLVNLAAGAVIVWIGRARAQVSDLAPSGESETVPTYVYGAAALLMGFAMMAIQTVWIRVGGLSLGSSEFTFSMVVAVFVLCIALGSLAVSAFRTIAKWLLPATLWILTALLCVLHGRVPDAPYYAHVIRSVFRDSDAAFAPYYLLMFLAILVVIAPVVVLSGSVLPLLFHAVRREVGDLGASAGRLYGLNTLGSLLGALLGGYVLLFWLDLEQVEAIAIAAVVTSALLVTARLYPRSGRIAGGALAACAAASLLWLTSWPEAPFRESLFRERLPNSWTYEGPDARPEEAPATFYSDGPTSTVAVQGTPGPGSGISLVVNGKSDGNTVGDLNTMALAALVPALFSDRAEESFVIGFGTGITAGELAALSEARRVVVAEISHAVIDAAPFFDASNGGVTTHPKVDIVRRDAYRALLERPTRYDVIVSEPSNPWVAGVEMLFSREFLEAARDRLRPGGVYAQWFHLYETDEETLHLVLRTYTEVFEAVSVWQTIPGDLLLFGFEREDHALDLERLVRRARGPDFAQRLARLGIDDVASLLVHEVLPLGVLHAAELDGPVHTLSHPLLNHRAGRAFFRGGYAELPFTGTGAAARIGAENALLARHLARFEGTIPPPLRRSYTSHACDSEPVPLHACSALLADWARTYPRSKSLRQQLDRLGKRDQVSPKLKRWQRLLGDPAEPIPSRVSVVQARAHAQAFRQRYHHALPFDPSVLVTMWERCGTQTPNPECAKGLSAARDLAVGISEKP